MFTIIQQKETSEGTSSKEYSRKYRTFAEAKERLLGLAKHFDAKMQIDEIGQKFDCIWKDYFENDLDEKFFICEVL